MTAIRTKPEPACPRCGAKMILRKPKEGQTFKAFWGCGDFPNCKGTRQIGDDGRPESMDDEEEEWGE